MATSGQCATNIVENSKQAVDWQRASYNINVYPPTSTINWQLWLNLGHNYYLNAIKNYGVNINGGSVYAGNTWSNYNRGDYQVASGSVTITHNNDGNKTFNINLSGWYYESGNVSGSQDFALDRLYSGATTNSVNGIDISKPFKINYTTHGGNYTYKLRVSIPSIVALERVDYNTSGADFTLSQNSINELLTRYPSNTSFNLGFAIESYDGGNKVADGNEVIITANIVAPTVTCSETVVANRTSLQVTYDYDSGVSVTSKGCEVYDSEGTYIKTVTGDSPLTVDSLTPNTSYKIKAFATNRAGTGYSSFVDTITSGNAPNVTGFSTFIQVGVTQLSYTVTYDTNSEFYSEKIEYGKTPAYGTVAVGRNIVTEDNNTLYYFKITVTDNFNRKGTLTGWFTSGGNAPIINTQQDYLRANKVSYTFTPTYDTNAHFQAMQIQYFYEGESEQHTVNYNQEPSHIVIDNLKANKYYTLKIVLVDNFNHQTINMIYFKTPSGMKINGMISTELKFNGKVVNGIKLNGKVLYE